MGIKLILQFLWMKTISALFQMFFGSLRLVVIVFTRNTNTSMLTEE